MNASFHKSAAWENACLLVAAGKVLVGIISFLLILPPQRANFPPAVHFCVSAGFGAIGALLLSGSRKDRRARYLGAVFLLIACPFSDPIIYEANRSAPQAPYTFFSILRNLSPEAFSPYFIWLFFESFPLAPAGQFARRTIRCFQQLSLLLGILLFLANLSLGLLDTAGAASVTVKLLRSFTRRAQSEYFWLVIFILALPALPFAVWRARDAPLQERRRVQVFLWSIVVGSAPLMLEVVAEVLVPPFKAIMRTRPGLLAGGLVIYPLLLSIPVMTTYSILVNHVLDVRLIVRKALQYALARSVLVFASLAPIVLLAFYVYQHREQTVAGFLSDVGPAGLVGLALAGGTILIGRRRVSEALDRRYFREQYDSRRILGMLLERCTSASDLGDLSKALISEIDRALHLHSIALLVVDPAGSLLAAPDGHVRPVPVTSGIVAFLGRSAKPADVDLTDEASPFFRMPVEDRQWLADGAFRLLVPIAGLEGSLLGMLALGEKMSELPFSSEDRLLLTSIANSTAMTLSLQTRKELRQAEPEYMSAMECRQCGRMHPSGKSLCDFCRLPLEEAPVPYVLLGKFRFERLVGAGGMGVVYRATDLVLDRAVAIKTLPQASPTYSFHLRQEARAMAAVSHPNLALIYGAETWKGLPMLVFEFLEGGTLADRLDGERIPVLQALELGMSLANVLQYIHSKGILHRDIKPSNIGYQLPGGVPKLLDFGLAHILQETGREEQKESRGRINLSEILTGATTLAAKTQSLIWQGRQVIGTPLYLSPEAIRGAPAGPSFDLWAAAMVLYVAIAGRHPYQDRSPRDALNCIAEGNIPPVRTFVPDCPEAVSRFLLQALANDAAERPPSARDFGSRLAKVRLTVVELMSAKGEASSAKVEDSRQMGGMS